MTSRFRAGKSILYGRAKHWKKRGFIVLHTSSSSGVSFSFICVRSNEIPTLICIKSVRSNLEATSLLKVFKARPPLVPSGKYRQVLEVQVKGSKDILTIEV